MKTALEEFIGYLEGIEKRDNIPSWVKTTAKNYLQVEKQQIIDACMEFSMHGYEMSKNKAEEYYNKIYTKND